MSLNLSSELPGVLSTYSWRAPTRALLDAFNAAIIPPERLTVSQWAEKNRKLSSEASAMKGQWYSWPFQKEPMDLLSSYNPTKIVVLQCASQMLKTEAILNMLGYVIDIDPGPVLIVEPREMDAESLSKDRVTPMIRDTPVLRQKMLGNRKTDRHDKGNTTAHKRFPGGHVTFVGANSPSGLAMRPIRYLLMDEVDRYPISVGKEGDPINIALKRTTNFPNRKIIICSTPTLQGRSKVNYWYELSDKRQYQVPCPYCSEKQVLKFENLEWGQKEGRFIPVDKAHYRCSYCDRLIPNEMKYKMIESGLWVKDNPSSDIAGFHLSQLYSYMRPWGDIAKEYLDVKKDKEQHQTFVNTVLADTWKDYGDAPDWERIKSRAAGYEPCIVPRKALFLTAGTDVQKDYCETYVWGWGRNKHRFLIDKITIMGAASLSSTKEALTKILNSTYMNEDGVEMPIQMMAIDSGFDTPHVYDWARRAGQSRVMVIKGVDTGAAIVGHFWAADYTIGGKKVSAGVRVYPVNVSWAKNELYGFLNQTMPKDDEEFPYGWVFYPLMEDEFYKQLVAEVWVERQVRGKLVGEWVKTRARNEALDCANYARAAANLVGFDRYNDRDWERLEAQIWRPKITPIQVQQDRIESSLMGNTFTIPAPVEPAKVQRNQQFTNRSGIKVWGKFRGL